MMLLLLTLVDIHTLFVLIFHDFLSPTYVLAGSTFAMTKGIIFYLGSRDLFSMIDIIIGVLMLFLLIGNLFSFISWMIGIYLVYKIVMSLALFK